MATMPSAVATAAAAPELRLAIRFPRRARQMLGWLEDAGALLLLALAFPLVILVVGTPVALVVRLLIEFSRRWW